MDKYYGNVCELDIIFNFQKAYFILDELLLAGEMQESSKKNVLRCINQQDSLEEMEVRLLVLYSRLQIGGHLPHPRISDSPVLISFASTRRGCVKWLTEHVEPQVEDEGVTKIM